MIPSLVHLREHAFVSGNLEGELQLGTVSQDLIEAILGIHEPAEIRKAGRMLAANDDHKQLGETYLARAETLMTAARALGLEKEAMRGGLGTVAKIKVGPAFESFLLLLRGQCFPKLEQVDLTSCTTTGQRMESFSDAILKGRLASCTELNLRSNGINDADMQSFSMAIAKTPLPRLFDLDLGDNKIGDIGLTAFATALHIKALPLLNDLEPRDESLVGDEGMKALASAIGSRPLGSCTVLNLSSNKIGDIGMKAFSNAISSSGALRSLMALSLNKNKIGDVGMEAFGNAIINGALESIRLIYVKDNTATTAAGNDKMREEIRKSRRIVFDIRSDL